MERCKHGLALSSCATCANPRAFTATPPRTKHSFGGGVSEVYRGFTIYYTPPPEREWSFRSSPNAPLESHRSAAQARRAINMLLDGTSVSTPRRTTSVRPAAPATRPRTPPSSQTPSRPLGRGVAEDEVGVLLAATSVRDLVLTLPMSGRVVNIRAYQRNEDRWTGELPANFRTIPNKVALAWAGAAVYPEFAIVGRLKAAGWDAVWRVNWHGRAFWSDIAQEAAVPGPVLEQFERISAVVGMGGAWDILAWNGARRLFIESKQRGSDKLTVNQLRWLEAAIEDGVPQTSFAVYEYTA